jgi:hypothetical protein
LASYHGNEDSNLTKIVTKDSIGSSRKKITFCIIFFVQELVEVAK